ncbi:MAG: hypothetical protein HY840_06575 [Bacteroidetes bacterium]|nr:hypothetical protein [Bacteroidota bacterium]
MKNSLPKEVECLLNNLFTLIGESLIDEQIENRKPFEKVQNQIAVTLKKYKVKGK